MNIRASQRCVPYGLAFLGLIVAGGGGCVNGTPTIAGQQAEASSSDTPPSSTDNSPTKTAGTERNPMNAPANEPATKEIATFGAGCFWCVEAVFLQLDGVLEVESGYSGGHVENPTYRQVCDGTTGHAEVCQVTFDPAKIKFEQLLEVFWKTHDPTTPNQQGYDIGPQYRSAVFYHNDKQRELAEKYKKELDQAGAFDDPIVTEITAYKNFYKAEDYHQNYFNSNPGDRYCRAIIQPKVDKVRQVFAKQLKKE